MSKIFTPEVKTYREALRAAARDAFSAGSAKKADGAPYAAHLGIMANARDVRGYPVVSRTTFRRYFADRAEAEAAVETLRANMPEKVVGVGVFTKVLDGSRG